MEDFYASLRAQKTAHLRHVYEDLLSGETRAALDARAQTLSASSSVDVKPWDVFVYRRLVRGDRVSRKEVIDKTSDTATVTVSFAWYVPDDGAEAKQRRPEPEPVTVTLRREDGQWRIHLPELAGNRGP